MNTTDSVFNIKMIDGNIFLIIDDKEIKANNLAYVTDKEISDDKRMELAHKRMNSILSDFEVEFFDKSKEEVLKICSAFLYLTEGKHLLSVNAGSTAKSNYKGQYDSDEQMMRSTAKKGTDPYVFDLIDFDKFKMKNHYSHNGVYFKKSR